ncbi:MAG: hypothetical protein M1818_001030 [Claussenomyces sp. TS43310]|nr:MAG: hypothetical protein M1818_001030 [Claussenomyces sp. TS43310]
MADSLPPAHAPPRTKLTVLISGSGTNLQALIDACRGGLLPSTSIVRVISDRKNAYGLTRAERAGIPTGYHNLIFGGYYRKGEQDKSIIAKARERFDADLASLVLADGPDLVVCAGFMHVLTPLFLQPLASARVPVINLHPARPGEFDGINAIQRAWQDYQDGKLRDGRTGVMVHYVVSEVDRGDPILVRDVECRKEESLEDLTTRIHVAEHDIIVKGTAMAIATLWGERRNMNGQSPSCAGASAHNDLPDVSNLALIVNPGSAGSVLPADHSLVTLNVDPSVFDIGGGDTVASPVVPEIAGAAGWLLSRVEDLVIDAGLLFLSFR